MKDDICSCGKTMYIIFDKKIDGKKAHYELKCDNCFKKVKR